MKKRIVVLMTIMMLIGLNSCKKKNNIETPNTVTPSTQEPSNSNESQEKGSMEDLIFKEMKKNNEIVGYKVCGLKNETLKEIILPRTYNNLPVISIEESAFSDCKNLTRITILNNETTIGKDAFNGCLIEYANIPTTAISSIPKSKLKEVVINSGESIESSAFSYCSSLMSVTISSSVKTIGSRAFDGCTKLDNVYYDGTIEDWCKISYSNVATNPMYYAKHFYLKKDSNWEEVTSIEIQNSIDVIGDYQFYGFNNVTSITIPNSVESIGDYAFSDCCNLKKIIIPDSVTSIGNWAFSNCETLETITIPNNVTSIGKFAFSDCDNLRSIEISNGVRSIEVAVFESCDSLDKVYYNGTKENWDSIKISSYNTKLTSATIYYYSEVMPMNEEYKYWHHDGSGNIAEW